MPNMQNDMNEIPVPAPPPFLFYHRRKRTEIGVDVVQEASFSTSTANTHTLRPQRSTSVGNLKLIPAMAKVTCNGEGKSRTESLVTSEEARGLSSDGPLAEGRGKGNGKGSVTPKDAQNSRQGNVTNGEDNLYQLWNQAPLGSCSIKRPTNVTTLQKFEAVDKSTQSMSPSDDIE